MQVFEGVREEGKDYQGDAFAKRMWFIADGSTYAL